MSRLRDYAALSCLALACACARHEPPPLASVHVGPFHVRFLKPAGWEHLDHGRQQLFRAGDNQLSLVAHTQTVDESMGAMPALDTLWIRDRVLPEPVRTGRHEIARSTERTLHDIDWLQIETWDRTSHLSRARYALTGRDGAWLVLAIDRGPARESEPAFEALLSSIELAGDSGSQP